MLSNFGALTLRKFKIFIWPIFREKDADHQDAMIQIHSTLFFQVIFAVETVICIINSTLA
ncbi:hypothetical protein P872_06330 [Rhodonellum psychrophilum GCM71 = DSM 17998]|uniref:Uncharacterized protein n=1 Tax=Rhodonellum psychrophilum GCM71 = DSM 17998 TaxID=1123057 RepID=U5C4F4_9BACT|nr:hypothetical protein P872_06330 [Rhodonellum psychrophilum GCM71 = DSM 17998]